MNSKNADLFLQIKDILFNGAAIFLGQRGPVKTYHMQSLEYNQKTFWSEMQNEIGSCLPKLDFLL